MKRGRWLGGMCLIVVAAGWGTAVAAPADDLQRAVQLYNARDYVQARNVLLKIDPTSLDDAQRAVRADYLKRTQPTMTPPPTIDQVMSFSPKEPPLVRPAPTLAVAPPIITYPSHWAQVLRRAQRYGAAQRTEDKPTQLLRQKFNQVTPEIGFASGTTFHDAIERIADESGMNIYINWPTLELAGVSRDVEVALPTLKNVTWRKVLDLILRQVSATLGGAAQLDWAIDSGVLSISTSEELSTHLVSQVYDVGDLLVPRRVVGRTDQGNGTGTTGTDAAGLVGGGTGTAR